MHGSTKNPDSKRQRSNDCNRDHAVKTTYEDTRNLEGDPIGCWSKMLARMKESWSGKWAHMGSDISDIKATQGKNSTEV